MSFTEVELRCAVVVVLVHNNGKVDNRTIANTIGDMRTIQRTRKKLEESKDPRGVITRVLKSVDNRRKSSDAGFVKRIETMINNDPSKSMKSMATELGVDKQTIQHCVDEDLQGAEQCSLPCLQPLLRLTGGALLPSRNQAPTQQSGLEPNLLFLLGHLKESN
ncbi:hypothetical protein FHG87_008655 [Trinorchestia longiramus]|nr:hypothetical protein FHG87_008655 [Trinorchestia longiramus]